MDKRMNIYISDIRGMLDSSDETSLCKSMIEDRVLSLDEVIDLYSEEDLNEWLEENCSRYGYTKEE